MKTNLLPTLFLTLVLLSCGGKSSLNPILNEGPGTEVTGEWNYGCQAFSAGGYGTSHAIFGTTSFEQTSGQYSDAKCESGQQYSMKASGKYLLGQSGNTKTIDFDWQNMELTPLTDAYASFLNAFAVCGIKDWKSNQARQCPADSAVRYTIYELSGTSLYFGKTTTDKNGKIPSARPDTIDKRYPYIKQ